MSVFRRGTAKALGAALWLTLALIWAALVRQTSETWWWVSVADLVPPQVCLLLLVPLLFEALSRKQWLRASGWSLCVLWLLHWSGWTWNAPSQVPTTLNLLSLNADFASAPAERVAALARREGADIVVLQEALDRERQGKAYRQALQAAFPNWYFAQHDELVTLSRWPIVGSAPVTFPRSPHALLWTRIEVGGRNINLYNVHLPTNGVLASESDQRLGRTLPQRVAKRLSVRRDFLSLTAHELKRQRDAVILAGDFNASPRGELAQRLPSLGLSDSFAEAGRGFGFTHAAQLGHSRIDFVWTREMRAVGAATLPDRLSDHRPLLVRFQQ